MWQNVATLVKGFSINQLLYLPKAELKTKNSTRRGGRLVEFLVFNSIH